jgi:hypothetical protein
MVGYVGRIDPETRTIDIAEDLAGVRTVTLAVTEGTAIIVHGKPSGLTDLSKDTPVRVAYEVHNDVKYVTAIQVVTEEPRPTQANAVAGGAEVGSSAETKPAETMPAATLPTADRNPVAETMPAAPSVPSPAAPASAPRVPLAPSSSAHALAQSTAKSPPPPASPSQSGRGTAVPTAAPRRPADADAGDGTAAVDWLLRGADRR